MKLSQHPTPWTVKQHGTRKMTVRKVHTVPAYAIFDADGNPVFYCASERTANCIADQANSQDMRKSAGIRYVGKAVMA